MKYVKFGHGKWISEEAIKKIGKMAIQGVPIGRLSKESLRRPLTEPLRRTPAEEQRKWIQKQIYGQAIFNPSSLARSSAHKSSSPITIQESLMNLTKRSESRQFVKMD